MGTQIHKLFLLELNRSWVSISELEYENQPSELRVLAETLELRESWAKKAVGIFIFHLSLSFFEYCSLSKLFRNSEKSA